jgi:hypothetical protein
VAMTSERHSAFDMGICTVNELELARHGVGGGYLGF